MATIADVPSGSSTRWITSSTEMVGPCAVLSSVMIVVTSRRLAVSSSTTASNRAASTAGKRSASGRPMMSARSIPSSRVAP